MRKKYLLLFICLFISIVSINAQTISGSSNMVNIRNTIVNEHNYKNIGYYNTTYTKTTEKILHVTTTKSESITQANNYLNESWGCTIDAINGEGTSHYCHCSGSNNQCKLSCLVRDEHQNCSKYQATIYKTVKKTEVGYAPTSIMHYTITNPNNKETSTAYCIQPSKIWPGSSSDTSPNYILNKTVDVRQCKTIADRSVGYSCGLAEIFYQIKKGNFKELSNEDENYGIIGAALRMWTIYWYKFTNLRDMAGLEQESLCGENGGECVTGEDYVNKPVYYNTVNAVLMGYTGSSCSSKVLEKYGGNSNEGILCWKDEASKKSVTSIIKLFNYLRQHQNDEFQDGRFGDIDNNFKVELYITEKKKIENLTNTEAKWTMTVEAKVSEEIKNQIIVKCNPETDNCESIVEVIDAYGNSIGKCSGSNIKDGKSCYEIEFNDSNYNASGKDSYSYTFKLYNYRTCVKKDDQGEVGLYLTKPGITFKLKGGATGFANVRQYISASNPANKQVMMTYIDDYQRFPDINVNIKDESKEYYIPFDLSDVSCDPTINCDPTKKCNTLEQTTDISGGGSDSTTVSDVCSSTTNSEGFSYKTIQDPNMSCIINNCDENGTLEYETTNKFNVNTSFCKVYCRDEVRFYIPSPTAVLAGMQLSYDLGSSLKKYVDSDFKQIDESKRLTAVVVRYKQCTSIFNAAAYYNSASPNKEEEKDYCLMNDKMKTKILGSNDKAYFEYDNNTNEINLEVAYEEGNNLTIEADHKKTIESVTYCKNNCYQVNTSNDKSSCTAIKSNFSTKKPTNISSTDVIYSTMIVKVQSDYYLDTEFSYEPISGKVHTGKVSINNQQETKINLPKYSYPICIETKTGTYNINYRFSNISKDTVSGYNKFNFACNYTVYNFVRNQEETTETTENPCFYVDKDGYAIEDENCIKSIEGSDGNSGTPGGSTSTPGENKKYSLGITYRNIGLTDMFPVKRSGKTNWYRGNTVVNPFAVKDGLNISGEKSTISVGKLIDKTENIGDNIYNDEHLEKSYYLSTDTIEKIKEYNKTTGYNYLNNTVKGGSCVLEENSTYGQYYKCKSTFLDKMKNEYNALVGGSK